MSKIIFPVIKRENTGKGSSKKYRRDGYIPGVVYGDQKAPEAIAIKYDEFYKGFKLRNFFSSVFELDGVDAKTVKYIVKEVQYHPVTDVPLHVDFMRIAKGNKVAINVAVEFVGQDKAPGLKRGGVLNVVAHDILVMCDPDNIPESIKVNLEGADFHHTVKLHSIELPNGVELPVNSKDMTIATVVAPTIIKDEPKADDAAAAAPAESESK